MQVAFCTQDQEEYTAERFANLSEAEIATKRRQLTCLGCGNAAYFKREAKSGTGACFGARPHEPGCRWITGPGETQGGLGNDQDILHNVGSHVVLDLAYGAAPEVHADPNAPTDPGAMSGRFTGTQPRGPANRHMRLRPVLKNLIYSEAFRNSDQSLDIPGLADSVIRDFFINFDDIQPGVKNIRGFWGVVFDANEQDGSLWLNTGRWDQFSVLLEENVKRELLDRFRVRSIESLGGYHALVIGTLSQASWGKLYIKVEGIDRIALYED